MAFCTWHIDNFSKNEYTVTEIKIAGGRLWEDTDVGKLRNIFKRKSGIYRKLLLSFLIILGIPILASAFFYSCTMDMARRQSDRLGKNILNMTRNEIDSYLEGARKFESRWFMDEGVREIADIEGEISREYSHMLLSLFNELVKQSATENIIKKAFIYFGGSDKVVSTDGNMDLDLYYQLYLENTNTSCEELRALLKEHHQYDTVLLNGPEGEKNPIMLLSIKNSRQEADAATIGVLLDYKKIQGRLPSANTSDSNVELMVLAENGEAITPENGIFHLKEPDYSKFRQNDRYLESGDEGDIWVTSLGSEQTNWTYLMLTTSGAFARDISRVRMIFITGLFLSICTGFGLSWYLAGKNYNPFVKIMDLLKTQAAPPADRDVDEMQWLGRQVQNILQKNVDAQKMLSKNKKHMREFCLWNLLMGECEPGQLERYEIHFPYGFYLTAILQIKPIMQNGKTDEQTAGLRRFIVHNIFSELVMEQYRAECFEFGDRVVTIFNLPQPEAGVTGDIRERMEKLREMVYGPFHFDIRGLIGSVHSGQEGIRASYREAAELSEYLVTLDETIISVEDICGMETGYGYTEGMGEKLAGMVSVGNAAGARELICQVFETQLSGGVSPNLYRSLVYEMIGSILKGAAAAGCRDAALKASLPKESVIRRSMEDTKDQLLRALEEICDKVGAIRRATADNFNLSREIEAYIDQHFSDPDLNISITSQHFDRSPAYLSGIYKKQTGKSLLEYINMKRIACAEELLKDGASVVEAAERSGFRDSGGFIRTFKRYRGFTPGQIKGAKKGE